MVAPWAFTKHLGAWPGAKVVAGAARVVPTRAAMAKVRMLEEEGETKETVAAGGGVGGGRRRARVSAHMRGVARQRRAASSAPHRPEGGGGEPNSGLGDALLADQDD